jgi:ABC-type sugar transport system ATPase subunit
MASVEFEHVTVGSGRTTRLRDVTISVADGSFVGVVGASGSGKTSLFRAIAGLDRIAHGTVRFDGRDVTRVRPGDRDVGMVFQRSVLIGHLSARRNVSFPLDVRHLEAHDIHQRVEAEVRALHIEALMDRDPSTLSVGEQQMVQIARALVRVPTVLLLDEPFSALDDHLRTRLRAEIAMLQSGYGVTTLMASNDSADIEALADLVVVLDDGQIAQVGESAEVRRAPVNLLAAVATGRMSLIEMTVIPDRGGFWLVREDPAGGELVRLRSWTSGLARYAGATVIVGVRPGDVEITETGTVSAVVERTAQFGTGGVSCLVAGTSVTAAAPLGRRVAVGGAVQLHIHHHVVFDRGHERRIV